VRRWSPRQPFPAEMMRLSLRAASLLAVALTTLSCTDAPTGPGAAGHSRVGRLGLAPSFSPSATRAFAALDQIGVQIARVRIRLVNTAAVVVKDTMVDFPADKDTLTISVPVSIQGAEESFTVTVDLTDATGVVLFSSTQTVTARDASLPAGTPPVITLEFVGPGATARAVAVSPATGTVSAAGTQLLTASATDAAGTAVSNLLVLWSSSDTTIARIVTSDNTTASVQGTGRRGAVTFTARTLGGVSGTAQLTFLPLPGRLVAVSGGAQSGPAGRALPQPFVAQLLGVDSLGIAGQTVAFRSVTAGGTVTTATVTTDSAGLARTVVTLGRTPGAYQFEAAAGTLTATVQETAGVGAAAQFVVTQPLPAQLSVGAVAPLPFRAVLSDDVGNPVATAGVVLNAAATVAPGGQTFSASASTDSTGALTLPLPVYLGAPGTATVVLSSPAFGTISTTTIQVLAGPAAALKIVQQPSATAMSGVVLAQVPKVQLVDVGGNAVSGPVAVTASVSGGAALGGATAVTTAADGSATFTGMSVSGLAGSYTLSFSAPSIAPATSNAITLGAGAAAKLAFIIQPPDTITVGAPITPAPSARLLDAQGNAVRVAGVTLRTRSSGNGVSVDSVLTDANGEATLPVSQYTGPTGTLRFSVTADGLDSLVKFVTARAGAPFGLKLVQAPAATATNGTILSPAPTLQAVDAGENPVSSTAKVTAALSAGPGTLAGTLTITPDAGGKASFADLRISGQVGSYTLTFTAPGMTAATTAPIALSAAAADHLGILAAPSDTAMSGIPLAKQPVIVLFDNKGNQVRQAGVQITAALATGVASVGNSIAVTDTTGVAHFGGLSLAGSPQQVTVKFTASGLVDVTSGPIQLVLPPLGPVTHFHVISGAGQVATVTDSLPGMIVVESHDANHQRVPNVPMAVVRAPGNMNGFVHVIGATCGTDCTPPDSVNTDANGKASFSWHVSNMAKVDTVRLRSAGLPDSIVTATALVGPATQLIFTAPNGLDDDQDDTLSPFTVHVSDVGGIDTVKTATGVVTIAAQNGDGTPNTGTLSKTLNNGVATFDDIAFQQTGTFFFNATFDQLTGRSDDFDISTEVPPHFVIVSGNNQTGGSGSLLPQQVVIQALSPHGDRMPGIPVFAFSNDGDAHLVGAPSFRDSTLTDSGGRAYIEWRMPSYTGQVQARISNSANSIYIYATSVVGPPANLLLQIDSTLDDDLGNVLNPIGLSIVDSGGSNIVTSGVKVTVTLVGGASGAVLSGTTHTTVNGPFRFEDLKIDRIGIAYKLRFTADDHPEIPFVETPEFDISPPPGGQAASLNVATGLRALLTPNASNNSGISFVVKDGQGQPLQNVGVHFTSSSPTVCYFGSPGQRTGGDFTDAQGVVKAVFNVGANPGGCEIAASISSASLSATAEVAVYPSGFTHVWFGVPGSNAGDFSADTNWLRIADGRPAVPASTDSAYIPHFQQSYPQIGDQNHTLARLGMEEGSYLFLGQYKLAVNGNVEAKNANIRDNQLIVGGTGSTVSGMIEQLVVGRVDFCANDAATLHDVNANTLYVVCAAAIGPAVFAQNTLNASSSGSKIVMSTASNLAVGDAMLGGSLTTAGIFTVAGNADFSGGSVNSAGPGRIAIAGAAHFFNNVSLNPGVRIEVRGDATFTDGTTSADSIIVHGTTNFDGDHFNLPAGVLELHAYVHQTGTNPSGGFLASGEHLTRLVGTGVASSIYVDNTATMKFARLQVENGMTNFSYGASQPVTISSGTDSTRLNILPGARAVFSQGFALTGGNIQVGDSASVSFSQNAGITPGLGVLRLFSNATLNAAVAPFGWTGSCKIAPNATGVMLNGNINGSNGTNNASFCQQEP
jgi:hypothetical protein